MGVSSRLGTKIVAREKSIGSILWREQKRLWKSCPGLGLQSLWERAVDSEAAANTSVISMRKGVMTVSCSSGGWACELKLKGVELAKRMNEMRPPEKVVEIRFVHEAHNGRKSRK
jgi:predicted nucleic acid-binding Zn ribbon protein